MDIFDTHAHYDSRQFDEDREVLLATERYDRRFVPQGRKIGALPCPQRLDLRFPEAAVETMVEKRAPASHSGHFRTDFAG